VSRLLAFGDFHSDRHHLRGLVERAVEERCDALLCLGDSIAMINRHYGHLARDSEDSIRACLNARSNVLAFPWRRCRQIENRRALFPALY
jgi:hypothetical protein